VVRAAADAGLDVAGATTPGDHHRYTRADIARLAREVRAHSVVGVLTTAKDAERLRPFRPLPFDVHVLEHAVTIEPIDAGPTFADWLLDRRDTARGTAGAPRVAG
jgi:tetraacyldisaccharide-1-P 4'-kinase